MSPRIADRRKLVTFLFSCHLTNQEIALVCKVSGVLIHKDLKAIAFPGRPPIRAPDPIIRQKVYLDAVRGQLLGGRNARNIALQTSIANVLEPEQGPAAKALRAEIAQLQREVRTKTQETELLKASMSTIGKLASGDQSTPRWNENLFLRYVDLGLSIDARRALQEAGILRTWELVDYTEAILLQLRIGKKEIFTRKVVKEIKNILEALGLRLGMNVKAQGFPLAQ